MLVCSLKFPSRCCCITDFHLVAIIVSCVASLRQLFVASQNQGSSARAVYNETNDSILKKSKEGYSQDLSRSVGENDEVPMSPLSVVHVRQDFQVTRANPGQSADYGRAYRQETRFD